MIQRLQSLYLFLVVILGVLLFFMPVIEFTSMADRGVQRMFFLSSSGLEELTEEYNYMASELAPVTLQGIWGLALANALIPLFALVIIFLYKHRILQARLCIFLALLSLGYYGVLFIYVWFGIRNVAPDWDILFGACIPLVCFVFTVMAARAILKDEALVRAADRLR